jgi:YesN/AraC family two-component response regulator
VNDFLSLLENYYDRSGEVVQPSVNYFAQELHVTPNYLSDVIKFYTGKTSLEHIHQHIVTVAQLLLRRKTLTIAEIAYQLRFEYPNYFSRLFRKITGVSPSNFLN